MRLASCDSCDVDLVSGKSASGAPTAAPPPAPPPTTWFFFRAGGVAGNFHRSPERPNFQVFLLRPQHCNDSNGADLGLSGRTVRVSTAAWRFRRRRRRSAQTTTTTTKKKTTTTPPSRDWTAAAAPKTPRKTPRSAALGRRRRCNRRGCWRRRGTPARWPRPKSPSKASAPASFGHCFPLSPIGSAHLRRRTKKPSSNDSMKVVSKTETDHSNSGSYCQQFDSLNVLPIILGNENYMSARSLANPKQ